MPINENTVISVIRKKTTGQAMYFLNKKCTFLRFLNSLLSDVKH